MKKKILIFMIFVTALIVCPIAFASQNGLTCPTNPYYLIANKPHRMQENSLINSQSSVSFTASVSSNSVAPYETVTLTCKCNMDASDCIMQFWVTKKYSINVDYYTYYPDKGRYSTLGSTMTFNYMFVVPGTYNMTLVVYDSDGFTPHCYCSYKVTVTIPEGKSGTTVDGVYHAYETLDEITARIADECIAAGCVTDFEKTLWMHDWIVDNCYYDDTYRYYSAESALVRGYSVCDGYSKALELLLEAVGVESTRAIGGNHAWNAVKMDGKWYHVDATWDDPTNLTKADRVACSGNERHYYLGLTDDAINIDHICSGYESGSTIVCDSYENNYYVATGAAAGWTGECVTKICEMLTNRVRTEQTVSMPSKYTDDGITYAVSTDTAEYIYDVAAHYLQMQGWTCGSHTIYLNNIYYTSATGYMHMLIDVSDLYTLELPSTVDQIDPLAFASTDFMNVTLPEGMTSVSAGMFKNCYQIWNVTLPSTITYIAPDAFDGCEVKVYCQNSYTAKYCASKSIPYEMTD